MPKTRITLSLDTDLPCDKALLDFVNRLPKRTRSEILKEILLDGLDKGASIANPMDDKPNTDVPALAIDVSGIDPDEVVENLF